jgi:hypothetical protein
MSKRKGGIVGERNGMKRRRRGEKGEREREGKSALPGSRTRISSLGGINHIVGPTALVQCFQKASMIYPSLHPL